MDPSLTQPAQRGLSSVQYVTRRYGPGRLQKTFSAISNRQSAYGTEYGNELFPGDFSGGRFSFLLFQFPRSGHAGAAMTIPQGTAPIA